MIGHFYQFLRMKKTFDAPVFDELLKLNPWAKDFWENRLYLIRENLWNINGLNHAGNAETRDWLDAFLKARSQATLSRFNGSPIECKIWTRDLATIVSEVFSDPESANSNIGTPMRQISAGAYAVNNDQTIEEYTAGQFMADVLLLAQSSLRALKICETLDISSHMFPAGLDMEGTRFEAPLDAKGAKFGPFSEFSGAAFEMADFSQCHFYDGTFFTCSCFGSDVIFSGAVFHDTCGFDAATFSKNALFDSCTFKSSAQFCGTLFEATPDFSDATFEGDTTFEDSTFNLSAKFKEASFIGRVSVEHLPNEVRQEILSANHSSNPWPGKLY